MTDDTAGQRPGGLAVAVAGEERNLKITTPEDHGGGTAAGAGARWRTGSGFDVHRLAPGRRLVLGGLDLPHEFGLDGHSDADVVLHAITDALLGASPPATSACTSRRATTLGRRRVRRIPARTPRSVAVPAAAIEHVDVVHSASGRRSARTATPWRSIAAILGLGIDRVSIKATTSEAWASPAAAKASPPRPWPGSPSMADLSPNASASRPRSARRVRARGWRLATAKSCTGGLIAGYLTEMPAAPTWSTAAMSPTTTAPRRRCWGCARDAGDRGGSERRDRAGNGRRCPRPLRLRARHRRHRDRRPWRGSEAKPVGLVHIAAATRGGETLHERHVFPGDRSAIRLATVEAALDSHGYPWTRVRARDRSNERAAGSRSASLCRDGQPARDRRARPSRAALPDRTARPAAARGRSVRRQRARRDRPHVDLSGLRAVRAAGGLSGLGREDGPERRPAVPRGH